MRHAVSLLVVFCLAAVSLSAATFEKVTDAALVARAEVVVAGTVLDAVSRQREDRSIVTDYRLAVEEVLKGNAGATITITEFGGAANGLIFAIPGSAKYTPGSRVVAFLNARGNGTFFTSHMALGKFNYELRGDVAVLTRDQHGVDVLDEARALQLRDAGAFLRYVRDGVRGERIEAYAPAAELPATNRRSVKSEAAGDYAIVDGPDGGPFLPVRWPNCETNCLIGYLWSGDQGGIDFEPPLLETAMQAVH